MADGGVPERLLPAIRIGVFWLALPFISLLEAYDRYFAGTLYEVAACILLALLSTCVAVYWDRLIPARFREENAPSLKYLSERDSTLGAAIIEMTRQSAWGRWYAAQLLVGSGRPSGDLQLIHAACFNVTNEIVNGKLEVRGRLPGEMDYTPIPRTSWRSSALHFVSDPIFLWRLIIIPRGGAEIEPSGNVIARNPEAAARTAHITTYDSLIVDGLQFEKLWPKRERVADKARKRLIRTARRRRLDKDEIERLS